MYLLVVQLAVEGGGVDLGLRRRLLEAGDALGRGDHAEQAHVARAEVLQALDRHRGRAAGREHRVEEVDDRVPRSFGTFS